MYARGSRKGVKAVVDGEIWHEARPEWTVFLAEYESRDISTVNAVRVSDIPLPHESNFKQFKRG